MLKICIESGLVRRELGRCPWGGRAAKAGSGVRGGGSAGSISGGHGVKRLVFFFLRPYRQPCLESRGKAFRGNTASLRGAQLSRTFPGKLRKQEAKCSMDEGSRCVPKVHVGAPFATSPTATSLTVLPSQQQPRHATIISSAPLVGHDDARP